MPAIRVLHVTKTLDLGGAEMNLLNLASALDPAKVESHIGYSFGGALEEQFRRSGLALFRYARGSHRVRSPHTAPIICGLTRYIRNHRIDIVHTHNFNAHVWGLVAAKIAGVKVIEHVHDHRYTPREDLIQRRAAFEHYRFIKYFRNRSDRVVVLTKDQVRFAVEGRFCAAERVLELQNGISPEMPPLAPPEITRQRLGIAPDALVILSCSRIEPAKNIDLILRIAPRVIARHPRTAFVIAGSGPHFDTYTKHTRDLNLQRNIRFVGFHPNPSDLMAAADVYLAPTFLELHSIAMLEAMRLKLPLVVSAGVGCNSEFIRNNENGVLCDPFQDEPWIAALDRLLSDRALRIAIGSAGYETCRRSFDICHAARRFENLYSELLSA